jgi:hypothetical protein
MKPTKPKPTPMGDMPVGAVVFTLTRMDDETSHEVRETYYTKISETVYHHHGCIQGAPELAEDERPRYINVTFKTGFEYPMIATLPVFPIEESRYARFFPK